jgi:hypothetical protein
VDWRHIRGLIVTSAAAFALRTGKSAWDDILSPIAATVSCLRVRAENLTGEFCYRQCCRARARSKHHTNLHRSHGASCCKSRRTDN